MQKALHINSELLCFDKALQPLKFYLILTFNSQVQLPSKHGCTKIPVCSIEIEGPVELKQGFGDA